MTEGLLRHFISMNVYFFKTVLLYDTLYVLYYFCITFIFRDKYRTHKSSHQKLLLKAHFEVSIYKYFQIYNESNWFLFMDENKHIFAR